MKKGLRHEYFPVNLAKILEVFFDESHRTTGSFCEILKRKAESLDLTEEVNGYHDDHHF